MFVLCLALMVATTGAYASLNRGTAARAPSPFAFNVCVTAGLSLVPPLAGWFLEDAAAWLSATWFAALACAYSGHAFGVRNWGSPMSRGVFFYSLRQFPLAARLRPGPGAAACAAIAAVFVSGWMAARLDRYFAGGERFTIYLAGAGLLLTAAAVIGAATRISLDSDLVLGLILGGHGPMSGPPPDDPSMGPRRQRPATASRRPTVVLMVVDSLRPGNMSALGYHRQTTPFLDTLISGQGARAVPMAFSNCASTETAYWTLFSSRRTRHLAANAPCLHDMLRAAGFKVRFLLSGTHRHWMGMDYLYGSDYDTFTDNLNDEQLVEHAGKLPAPDEAGDFLFFHLMSTHMASGCEPPKMWKPARNRAAWLETGAPDAEAREQILNHYDNSVLQADGYIARIMETLRKKGYLDDALVVVTGDHGEALGERNSGTIGHARGLYQESIQIPLIVWDSTGPLPETAFLADLTDIAPTVLGSIGMVPPSSWQGSSLFTPPGRRSVHTEQIKHSVGELPTQMEALIAQLPSGVFKTMRYRQAGREVLRKAFCLSDDAGETRDLSGHLPPGVEVEMEHRMREYHDQPALAPHANWRFLERQG